MFIRVLLSTMGVPDYAYRFSKNTQNLTSVFLKEILEVVGV